MALPAVFVPALLQGLAGATFHPQISKSDYASFRHAGRKAKPKILQPKARAKAKAKANTGATAVRQRRAQNTEGTHGKGHGRDTGRPRLH